jgi:hypothetical protein
VQWATSADTSDKIAASSVEECDRLEREIGEKEVELRRLQSEDVSLSDAFMLMSVSRLSRRLMKSMSGS